MSKQCPLMGIKCLEDGCMWWTDFAVARAGDPENLPAERRWDCSINWTAIFNYSGNHRLLCTQAATESARNAAAEAAGYSTQLMRSAVVQLEKLNSLAEQRALERCQNGGMLPDARTD